MNTQMDLWESDEFEKKKVTRLFAEDSRPRPLRKSYVWSECDNAFKLVPDLDSDIEPEIPADVNTFHCIACKKTFAHKINLMCHMGTHSERIKCLSDLCKEVLLNESSLKIKDKGIKPFQCEKSSQKSGLDNHIRIPTKVRPFQCNVCKETFTQKNHLIGHMSAHNDLILHQINRCKKIFLQQSDLKIDIGYH